MAVILRRMLRIGKLPDDMRAQVDSEGVMFLAEFVPVTRRFSGRVPGLRSTGSISSYVGALVLTSQRVLGTLSSVPKVVGRAIDQRWDAPQTGAMTAEISSAGLLLDLDVGRVDPSFSGHLQLKYKTTIPDDVLTMLPTRSLAFDVPPEYVLRAVGVPASPN
jgi:hypothetical protein